MSVWKECRGLTKQDRSSLTVRLADADFILTNGKGNSFSGYSNRGKVYFTFGQDYYYYYYPPEYHFVERLGDMALIVYGLAEGSGPPSHLSGTMGEIRISSRTEFPFTPITSSCAARFEMVRR